MKITSQPFNYWNKPADKPAGGAERYFYRCPDCLVIVAVDNQVNDLRCDTCRKDGEFAGSAKMEFMGRVEQNKLVREYDKPVCDDRCTSARGPICVCRCLGANHGSHLWVTVKTSTDGLPSVTAPRDAERYREQAEQFRAGAALALQVIKNRYGSDNFERYQKGVWISNREVWAGIHYSLKSLNALWAAREHKSRMKKLGALILEVKGTEHASLTE